MPETIWGGYLQAQQQEQQQEELAEEKKRKKLEESLSQLQMKGVGRQMERDVERFKREQAQWELVDAAKARLRESGLGEELDRALAGLKSPLGRGAWTPTQEMSQMKLGLLQKLQREEEWTPGDTAVAGRIWPDKFASGSGLSPSQQISQMKLGLLQKTKEGEEWTEEEEELAKYMNLEKGKKPYITAPQMMNKFYSPNMLGMPMTWTVEQKMNNITAQERIAVMSGDETQLKEMDAVRVAEGLPIREQEQELLGVIASLVQQGDKREQIEAGLREMDYSNDYIKYLLGLAGVR